MFSRDRRREGGFTLIEVLLVLVILVVLASFVAVNVVQQGRTAKLRAAKSQIGMFKTPLAAYEMDINSYPTTAQGLQALRYQPPDLPNPTKWQGPYLDSDVPKDPWDNYYQYAYPGTHNSDTYDIWTISPEGQEIGNWSETGK
jgi:general secretion pathway protein G